MGVDLLGRNPVEFSINWTGWNGLFDMGVEFGWIPKGTSDPYGMERSGEPGRYFVPTPDRLANDGSYHSNDGWWVDPDDAISWAAALENALGADVWVDRPVEKGLDPFGDDDWSSVQSFIGFCHASNGFRIY